MCVEVRTPPCHGYGVVNRVVNRDLLFLRRVFLLTLQGQKIAWTVETDLWSEH